MSHDLKLVGNIAGKAGHLTTSHFEEIAYQNFAKLFTEHFA
jgi:hypothetical protein